MVDYKLSESESPLLYLVLSEHLEDKTTCNETTEYKREDTDRRNLHKCMDVIKDEQLEELELRTFSLYKLDLSECDDVCRRVHRQWRCVAPSVSFISSYPVTGTGGSSRRGDMMESSRCELTPAGPGFAPLVK